MTRATNRRRVTLCDARPGKSYSTVSTCKKVEKRSLSVQYLDSSSDEVLHHGLSGVGVVVVHVGEDRRRELHDRVGLGGHIVLYEAIRRRGGGGGGVGWGGVGAKSFVMLLSREGRRSLTRLRQDSGVHVGCR